jgi:fructose/tagatose bisphosphate aldolase
MANLQNIDEKIFQYVFSEDKEIKKSIYSGIRTLAKNNGAFLSSIDGLYRAFGQEKIKGFSVPAINIRTLTYDTAQIIFQVAKKNRIGPFIFEIARSEMKYTFQDPEEYAVSILAAAIKTDYHGPIFIQGDHYQFKRSVFLETPQAEIDNLKRLISQSVAAGFYNIDIDASTLVDLDQKKEIDQQKNNYQMTALLTEYIRKIQPTGVNISVGGEIGHIGGKNSTIQEFEAFMTGYLGKIKDQKSKIKNYGISKVSVQTGTSHGGTPLADGTIAKVDLDFSVLKEIGKIAQEKYHLGGTVQHGASTLSENLFDEFPKNNAVEVHLATGFQNTIFDNLPQDLKQKIYDWVKINCSEEKKPDQTEEQFIYKTRKKAFGVFKKELWQMSKEQKKPIIIALENQIILLFKKLNIFNTQEIISSYL